MSVTAVSVKMFKWETAVCDNGLIGIGRRKGSQEIKRHKRQDILLNLRNLLTSWIWVLVYVNGVSESLLTVSIESISDSEEWRSTGTLQGLHPNMGKNGTLEYYFLRYIWTAETTVLRNCTV